MRRERGFAMVLVIWALILMTGIASGFSLAVRYQTRLGQDAIAELQHEAATTAAVNTALYRLNEGDEELRWQANGQWHTIHNPDSRVRVRILAESGRIDINRAQRVLLTGLFEQIAPDYDTDLLVDALIDWRDRDGNRQPNGAEAADYRDLGYAYSPANRPFRSVHELSRVVGYDAQLVRRLLPHITIHSRQDRVNAQSADLLTLTAVPGIDEKTANSFIQQRELAMADGGLPPFSLLGTGNRYLSMNIDNKVIRVETEFLAQDLGAKSEQFVLSLGAERYYRILDRREVIPQPSASPSP